VTRRGANSISDQSNVSQTTRSESIKRSTEERKRLERKLSEKKSLESVAFHFCESLSKFVMKLDFLEWFNFRMIPFVLSSLHDRRAKALDTKTSWKRRPINI
jgi:hypothetical protein